MAWGIQSTISGLLQGQPDFPLIIDLIHALSLNISALEDLPQSPMTVESIVAYILQCADFRACAVELLSGETNCDSYHKVLL